MNILVVEDNGPEQIIMKEAFKEARLDHRLYMVKDGIEALEFLGQQEPFKDAAQPDIILLDLNMPRKNGMEVLAEIKKNPSWAHIPILVFSNSEFSKDVCKCYALGANAYVNKPVDFEGFVDIARIIDQFWFKIVRYCTH